MPKDKNKSPELEYETEVFYEQELKPELTWEEIQELARQRNRPEKPFTENK